MKKGFILLTVMAIAALLLVGCNPAALSPSVHGGAPTSSSKTGPVKSVSPMGTLTVLVTDAPSYTVNSVVVHFSEVWVHKANAEQEQAQEQAGGGEQNQVQNQVENEVQQGKGNWIQLEITGGTFGTGSFDLAELRDEGATAELAAAKLAAGKYTQLKVVMDEELGVQVDYDENEGDPVDADLSSGTLKFIRPFIVEADGSTEIVLDFDLQKSVVFTGNFGKEPNPNQNPNKPDNPGVIVKPVVKLQVTSSAGGESSECELDGELTLENKDPDTWAIIDDEIYGELRYSTEGEDFSYEFEGYGLENIEYSLIYYADTDNRFNEWGGDNPGALISTGTAVDGELTLSGSVFLGMDLPHPDDANGSLYDYTQEPDFYDNATGAKIWLVPSECYDAEDPDPIYKVTSWEPTRFLFETDLIRYEYTDVTAPAAPNNLIATPGDEEISLDWDDNSEADLEGYNVYRAVDEGGPYTKIDTTISSEYTDTGLINGTTYYYMVTAVDESDNESGYSDQVLVTPTSS